MPNAYGRPVLQPHFNEQFQLGPGFAARLAAATAASTQARSSREKEYAVRGRFWVLGFMVALLIGLGGMMLAFQSQAGEPVTLGYRVVAEFPHDRNAFCQGLVFEDGLLYEGTGKYGQSSLRQIRLEDGKVLAVTYLDRRYFGEGVTLYNDYIIQLTWREQTALIYDRKTLRLVGSFAYRGEGWGLTTADNYLIISEGTDRLRYLNAQGQEVGELKVRSGRRPVVRLNELEYIQGYIYANIWHSERLAKIDPKSGQVVAWIDLTDLYPKSQRHSAEDVPNGIAYDKKNNRIFVTGKNWPKIFQIEITDSTNPASTATNSINPVPTPAQDPSNPTKQ